MRPYAVRRELIIPAGAAVVTEALRGFVTEGKRLFVRATCHVPTLRAEIALERDIVVALSEGPGGWEVRWSPTDDGPFPRFRGALALQSALAGAARFLPRNRSADQLVSRGSSQEPTAGPWRRIPLSG